MPISVKCESCQAKLNAPDTAAGKKVKCPKCQGIITIPAAGAAPAAKASPAAKSAAPVAAKKKPAAQQEDDFASELDKLAPKKGKNEFDFSDDEDEAPAPSKKKASKRSDDDEDEPAPRKKSKGSGGEAFEDMPEEDVELIQGELQGNERVLWAGKPVPKVYMMRAIPYCFGTLLFWIMAGGMMGAMINDKNSPVILRIVMPIVLAILGTGFLFAPLFAKKRALRTVYALTNKRALVWDGGWFWGKSFEEFGPARLAGMKRQNSWAMKGAGDLVFKEEVHITTTEHRDSRGRYQGTSQSVRIVQHGFMGIADVGEVQKLIQREIVDRINRALED